MVIKFLIESANGIGAFFYFDFTRASYKFYLLLYIVGLIIKNELE